MRSIFRIFVAMVLLQLVAIPGNAQRIFMRVYNFDGSPSAGNIFFEGSSTVITPDKKGITEVRSTGVQVFCGECTATGGAAPAIKQAGDMVFTIGEGPELQFLRNLLVTGAVKNYYFFYTKAQGAGPVVGKSVDYYTVALGFAAVKEITEVHQSDEDSYQVTLVYGCAAYYTRKPNPTTGGLLAPVAVTWNFVGNVLTLPADCQLNLPDNY